MYQLLEFNVDYLATCEEPVFLVGTGNEAVNAYKRILIRSIQLGRNFSIEDVYSMDKGWIGKKYCCATVRYLPDVEKVEGIYLVAENNYVLAKTMIEILNNAGIEHIIVTLPVLQFPMKKQKFEENKELFRANKNKIHFVHEKLREQKSRIIWEKLLQARWDSSIDRSKIYEEVMMMSTELGNNQYFPVGEIFEQPKEEGIFIDGGALSGSSCIEFATWCKNHYNKIYTFEPDIRYYDLLDTNLKCNNIKCVEIMKMGLWDYTGTVSFSEEPIGASKVGCGSGKVPVISIDDLCFSKNEPVTYIKMDIEGSECKALDGARQIIFRDYPKLAICIYHGETDIFEVPYKIIHEFGYTKIHIRHYSNTIGESVIYAER